LEQDAAALDPSGVEASDQPSGSGDASRSGDASGSDDASRTGDASRPDVFRPGGASAHAEPVADDPEAANGEVEDALAGLDAAAEWPAADQVAAFTAAYETLQATLARIDDH
jgi:hypothetical protein